MIINNFKLALVAATAALGLSAVSANALTLKLVDNKNGSATISQTDTGDGSELFAGAFGGFDVTVAIASNTSVASTNPARDRLNATLGANNLSEAEGDITLMVSHVFDNTASPLGLQAAQLTQTLNVLEGMGDVKSYVSVGPGAAEFDTTTLINDLTADKTSASNVTGGSLDMDFYSITHVINISTTTQSEISGSARYVAPIPVPAAGILLLTAVGGLGLARRRRKAA